MSPHTVAPPPEEEALRTATGEEKHPSKPTGSGDASQTSLYSHELFHESLLELSTTRPRQRSLDFVLSMIFHTIFLGTLILVPLFFTEAIDLKQFTTTLLVAPPPPPPPPPPASPAIAQIKTPLKRVFTSGGKLMAPTVIPEKVAMLKEEPLPPDVEGGVAGGVPGGVPGGQAGGVIGGIISSAPRTYIPAAPTAVPKPKAPVRVGGRVRAPRPIATPEPVYPPLARQAKIQGDVQIDAVIDTSGNVVEMRVISGHPLLIGPAMEALRRWKYEPTYLNDEAVPVQLIVTVRFRLGS